MAEVIAPSRWSTACPDWQDRLQDGRSLVPDLPLDDRVARKALAIFKRLRVPDLIGTPTYGDVCEPWVFDLVGAIFGSYDPETKRRALREFFLLIPKKNGKSAIAAAIIVTAAILNERPNAELILIAPTQNVADIAFKQASGMIALDPDLDALFHRQGHLKKITHRMTGAEIKVLSADGDVVTGSKATYILVDETHVLAAKTKAPEIFTELRGGLASRPEGFMLQITTQSKKAPAGQFRRELQRARSVRDGKTALPLLPVLYELPEDMAKSEAWRDEATWKMVNPNLGRSVSLDYLRDEMQKAVEDGPDALALFASQHLNVEIGLGLHSDRWIGADYWQGNGEAGLTLDRILATSEVAVIGVDGGGADDLFSLAVIGRHKETRRWQAWVKAWCLDLVLERRKEIAPLLRDFEADGDLSITPTAEDHVHEAVEICEAVRASGVLPQESGLGFDAYGIAALLDALVEAGFDDQKDMTAVGQGFKLNGAIRGLERRLYDGNISHGNQPLLNWAVSNAKAEQRGNNVMITKQAAGTAKIDPLVALFNAAVLMDRNPVAARASYLETAELLVL